MVIETMLTRIKQLERRLASAESIKDIESVRQANHKLLSNCTYMLDLIGQVHKRSLNLRDLADEKFARYE